MKQRIETNHICDMAKQILGVDNYYNNLHLLEEDVTFFELYMKRNKKSICSFTPHIRYKNAYRTFENLYKRYNRNKQYLENTFSEIIVLEQLLNDIYNKTNILTTEQRINIIDYFEYYDDFSIDDNVSDFIGCSHGCSYVLSELEKLRKNN